MSFRVRNKISYYFRKLQGLRNSGNRNLSFEVVT